MTALSAHPALFDATVPVFSRYLRQLRVLLERAAAHADAQKSRHSELLESRLAPDMLPLATQVEIAVNFVYRTCAPLTGQPVPRFGPSGAQFATLQQRMDDALVFLDRLHPSAFADSASRQITDPAGDATVTLDAPTFVSQYALPNFFFHISMAYAILRHVGMPLGKADFDGWHRYPAPTY
ncbi:MAG: DUF1993 domain-containing protein [Curvibacter sp.]|nr:MAG: DUF1993 domain-containing protein [Curvibacter sp.]